MLVCSAVAVMLAIGLPAPKRPPYRATYSLRKDYGYLLEMRKWSGELIWSRRTNNQASEWSKDNSVFAFADAPSEPWKYGFSLHWWRIGKPIRKFHLPPLPDNLGEGIFKDGLKISPNKRYVVIRTAPTQGSFDLEMAWLIGVDIRTGRSMLVDGCSDNFRWIDSHTLEYYYYTQEGEGENVKWKHSGPNRWNVPRDWQ